MAKLKVTLKPGDLVGFTLGATQKIGVGLVTDTRYDGYTVKIEWINPDRVSPHVLGKEWIDLTEPVGLTIVLLDPIDKRGVRKKNSVN